MTDASKPFPPTRKRRRGAADGEKIHDPARGGWFQRSGRNWVPCDPPRGHLCIEAVR